MIFLVHHVLLSSPLLPSYYFLCPFHSKSFPVLYSGVMLALKLRCVSCMKQKTGFCLLIHSVNLCFFQIRNKVVSDFNASTLSLSIPSSYTLPTTTFPLHQSLLHSPVWVMPSMGDIPRLSFHPWQRQGPLPRVQAVRASLTVGWAHKIYLCALDKY